MYNRFHLLRRDENLVEPELRDFLILFKMSTPIMLYGLFSSGNRSD